MARLILLAILIGVGYAFRNLSLEQLVFAILLVLLFFKFLGGKMVEALFSLPFKAKGKVLRGATATVQSIRPIPAPPPRPRGEEEDEDEEDRDTTPRNYYLLEVTISPKPAKGKFTRWEIGELMLQTPGAGIDDEDDACRIEKVEFFQTGAWEEDQGYKIQGEEQVRLTLAVKPGVRELEFRYYFERFGRVVVA